jgi:DNA modification methylase
MYGWNDGAGHHRVEDRKETTVWEVDRDGFAAYQHPTQKPVALPARAIRNSSRPGDLVFDGFSGAGSTAVACAQLDRVFAGVELDPGFVDVIVARLEDATSQKATRVSGAKRRRSAG